MHIGHPVRIHDSTGGSEQTFCPHKQRRYVLIAAILASAMGFIDGSVVSIAIPAIRTDLAASLAQGQWISKAYMLFLSSPILLIAARGPKGIAAAFVVPGSLAIVAFVTLERRLPPPRTARA